MSSLKRRPRSQAVIDFYVELGPNGSYFLSSTKYWNPQDCAAPTEEYGSLQEFSRPDLALLVARSYAQSALAEDVDRTVVYFDGNEHRCYLKR